MTFAVSSYDMQYLFLWIDAVSVWPSVLLRQCMSEEIMEGKIGSVEPDQDSSEAK